MQYSAITHFVFILYVHLSPTNPPSARELGSQFCAETTTPLQPPGVACAAISHKKVNIMDLCGSGVGLKTPEKPTSSFAYYYIYALFYFLFFIFCSATSSEERRFSISSTARVGPSLRAQGGRNLCATLFELFRVLMSYGARRDVRSSKRYLNMRRDHFPYNV